MISEILRAIRDWCVEKFQAKGEYLTEIPEEYVTASELENSYLGGIRFGKDENGNPGYYEYDKSVDVDRLVPFKNIQAKPASLSSTDIVDANLILCKQNITVAEGWKQING